MRNRNGRVTATSILVPLLAFAACRPASEAPPPVTRLLELTPAVTGLPAGATPPAALELEKSTVVPGERGETARAAIRPTADGYDLRPGFFAPAGTAYRFALEAGLSAQLTLALAAWPAPGDEAPVTLRVSTIRSAGSTIVFERQLIPDNVSPWKVVAIPLAGAGPGPLTLEFTSEGSASTWVGWGSPELTSGVSRIPRTNLILIVLDTLRADRLGCYGYRKRDTTPFLDDFAARSIRFANAISAAPWTRPSHRALFSGRNPSFVRVEDAVLAETLWKEGYRTTAIHGGGQVDRRFGFARGFESYQASLWLRRPELVQTALAKAASRDRFLFLHTYEIHDPYTDLRYAATLPRGRAPAPFAHRDRERVRRNTTADEKEFISALYDGDLAFTDSQLGALLDSFERGGILDNSIVVITSDHGEEFWEHGNWRHGHSLYDEQLRVPLILWLPPALRRRFATAFPAAAGAAAVVEDQVGLIDLLPTLLEFLEIKLPNAVQGRSLVPLLRGERLPEQPLLGERLSWSKAQKKSLRGERYKFIAPWKSAAPSRRPQRPAEPELYDLVRDPAETLNLAPGKPEVVAELTRRLEALAAGGSSDEKEEPEPDDRRLREELQALGYVGE